jgi:hypothetical protein
MALLFVDGFDHYATADIPKKWNGGTSGTPAINTTAGRRGGGALRTTGFGHYVIRAFAATASFVMGASFKFSSFSVLGSPQAIFALWDASTAQCDLRANVDGTLSVTRNGTALTGGTSTNILSTNTEYYIEWKVTIADSIGANTCKVRVNGVDWVTVATSQDTKNTSNASATSLRVGQTLSPPSTITLDTDDFYLCDQSGSTNNDFLGDVRVDTLFPTSDGNYTAFTPSTGSTHYTLVNETAPNTTNYNDGAAVNDRDSYGLADLTSLTSQTVYGVQINAAINKDDAGSKSAATFVRSSSTNGDGASAALGTSQLYVSQVFETDPNGSIAWTQTSVNAMEAGVKVTA